MTAFFLLITCAQLLSQETLRYTIFKSNDLDSLKTQDWIKEKTDSSLLELHKNGFITASIENITLKNDSIILELLKGTNWKQHLNISSQDTTSTYVSLHETNKVLLNKLNHFQNIGYPFAAFKISSSNLDSHYIEINYQLDKGPLIRFDSLRLSNSNVVSTSFLYNYLNYKPGAIYSEAKLLSLQKAINNSGIIRMTSPPNVYFTNKLATPSLIIEKTNSNRFDGIIGIQPTEEKTSITGIVNLVLSNSLKRGEKISFDWERIQPENQRLSLIFDIPYIFKSKLGVKFSTGIVRQDSTLNRLKLDYGLKYLFNPEFNFNLGVSSIRNNSNSQIEQNNSNSQFTNYQTSVEIKKVDYSLNPKKGLMTELQAFFGTQKSQDNSSNVFGFSGKTEYFIPFKKSWVLKTFALGQSISGKSININDVYQTGGLNSIRGVDQRSILVTSWLTAGSEIRFVIDKTSSFFIFGETHYNETNITENYKKSEIQSFGLGLNIGSEKGLFSFSYGVANQSENIFLLRNGKINFGYTSLF